MPFLMVPTLKAEGQLREELRSKLRVSLTNIAEDWLQHGFNGGHIVAVQEFLKIGAIPLHISRCISREVPIRRKGKPRKLELSSKLPKKLRECVRGGPGI